MIGKARKEMLMRDGGREYVRRPPTVFAKQLPTSISALENVSNQWLDLVRTLNLGDYYGYTAHNVKIEIEVNQGWSQPVIVFQLTTKDKELIQKHVNLGGWVVVDPENQSVQFLDQAEFEFYYTEIDNDADND